MKILMVGSGGKGSMVVRGQQLGQAIGARVVPVPSAADLEWADLVILVKRNGLDWASRVQHARKPIVWDAVDFWEQPEQNALSERDAKALLQRCIQKIKPTLVIGATEAMALAAGGAYLPHHAWPNLRPTPARGEVKTVGYQGKRKYLGKWAKAVKAECDRRGWTFVLDPIGLRSCDLLVAFRDGQWDGWMCQEWKSGVKLVNALTAGRPIVTQNSAAWREIRPAGVVIEKPEELPEAFDCWTGVDARQMATQGTFEPYALPAVAMNYRMLLEKTFARVRVA